MRIITHLIGAVLPFIDAVPQKVDRKTRVYDASKIGGTNFALFSDPQLGMFDSYESRPEERVRLGLSESRNGSAFHNELGYVQKTVDYLNTQKGDLNFVVLTGDMVNQYPYGAIKDYTPEKMKEWNEVNIQQVNAMHAVLAKLEIPLFVVPGNHDVGNDFRQKAIDVYWSQWGADYYSFTVDDSLFLFLNTQIWKNTEKSTQALKTEMNVFIENVFNDAARDVAVKKLNVFQHYPMYRDNRTENLENEMSKTVHYYDDDLVSTKDMTDFFDKVERNIPEVDIKIYAGHLHMQDVMSQCGTHTIINSLSSNYVNKVWHAGKYGGVHKFVNGDHKFVRLNEM